MRRILGWACLLAWAALGFGVEAAQTKKAPAKTTAKKSSAKSGKKTTSSSKRKSRGTRTTWRNRQTVPAPERYKEIQEALAAKGYLDPSEATGAWGSNSIAALKRFQAEQNLQANGKINSLSLIALGLGPRRESPPAVIPADPPPPQVP